MSHVGAGSVNDAKGAGRGLMVERGMMARTALCFARRQRIKLKNKLGLKTLIRNGRVMKLWSLYMMSLGIGK